MIHCNDWQTALIPVYLNTVEWMQPLHASASIYSIHNLAYQGVFDGNAMFVTGLGREHYHPGELEHFGAMNLTKGALYHSTLLSTVSPTYAREIQTAAVRQRSRRRSVGAQRRPDRHPERHRHRRVEPGPRSPPAGDVFGRRPRRQGGVQGGAAKGSRVRGAPGRAALRRDRPADVAKGLRRARARAGSRAVLGRADRAAGHGRSPTPSASSRGPTRSAAIDFAPGCGSTTAAPTASRPAPTSS